MTRAGSGFFGSVSHAASALRRPVEFIPGGRRDFGVGGIENREETGLHFVAFEGGIAASEDIRLGSRGADVDHVLPLRQRLGLQGIELRQLLLELRIALAVVALEARSVRASGSSSKATRGSAVWDIIACRGSRFAGSIMIAA